MNNLKLTFLSLLLLGCGIEAGKDVETSDGVTLSEHRIFVTSSSYDGSLGGLSGADSLCTSLAQNADLKRTYKAILSDESSAAKDRLTIVGPIYVVAGSSKDLVAASGSELWGDNLLFAIDIDQNGDSVGTQSVWTGTTSEGGEQAGSTCSGWTSNASGVNGFYGSSSATSDEWVEDSFTGCNSNFRLYCISQ